MEEQNFLDSRNSISQSQLMKKGMGLLHTRSEDCILCEQYGWDEIRTLVFQVPAALAFLSKSDFRIELINACFLDVLVNDPKGKSIFDVFQLDAYAQALHSLFIETNEKSQSSQTRIDIEGVFPRPFQCSSPLVNLSFLPYKNRWGEILGILVFCQDMTEKYQAKAMVKEKENYFRSLAETLPQIIWTANPLGEITYTNGQWKEYTQSLDNNWLEYVHPEDAQRVRVAWDLAIKSGQALELDLRLMGKDNRYRWFLLRAVSSKDNGGKVIHWYGSATDIEDRKVQAKELADAKLEAERANATKSAFLANMSHEIRTPLGAILGFTELIRDPNLSLDERNAYHDIIARNGKALTRVIDDILDLTKVEAGHLNFEKTPFELPTLLTEITSLFGETVRSKGLYLSLAIDSSVPDVVLSDPARLRQILINIIGNAVKFTREGGVKVFATRRDIDSRRASLIISVIDTGPGLMRSQQKKLFQPFTQADNTTTRRYGGTGLGLALSRRLAQAMGGNVRISASKIRKGCTFEITVEVGLPQTEVLREFSAFDVAVVSPASKGILRSARVLLVEDAMDNQILIKRILTKSGADVEVASNGLEGVQKALGTDKPYHIILMDIQMPVMDGYEAIRKLRSSGYTGPVFALTAHAMAEERKKTLAEGYDGHLTKPLDTEALVQTVRRYCQE